MATLNIKNFDDRLYDQLKRRAQEHHRSMAQEVSHILEAVIRGAPSASLLELEGLGREFWRQEDAAVHVARERDSWA